VIVVDGKLLPVARVSRALTQRIKRGFGGKSWGVESESYIQMFDVQILFLVL